MSSTNELPKLDTCGCCEPPIAQHAPHDNPPGQPSVTYRIGRYSSFMRRMLERVPFQAIPDGPNITKRPLAGLVTGGNQDPAVALLDAWSSSLDVLTFYQERIANEGYLRTATERRSVLELARTIGYELNPGVAASTHLVFTVESALGTTTTVQVPVGTRIQNVPTTQTLPQTFETVEEIEARAELNVLYARRTKRQSIGPSSLGIYLKGTATLLQPGDILLLVGKGRYEGTNPSSPAWYMATVTAVTINAAEGYTYVTWGKPLSATRNDGYAFPIPEPRAFALRQRAALFGSGAPDWKSMSQAVKDAYGNGTDWPNMTMSDSGPLVLDAAYPKFYGGGWMVVSGLTQGSSLPTTKLYNIMKASGGTRSEFTLTGRVTIIEHDVAGSDTKYLRRETVVFGQSEELEVIEEPQLDVVEGTSIELDRHVPSLLRGRTVMVSGRRARLKATKGTQMNYTAGGVQYFEMIEAGEIVTVISRRVLFDPNAAVYAPAYTPVAAPVALAGGPDGAGPLGAGPLGLSLAYAPTVNPGGVTYTVLRRNGSQGTVNDTLVGRTFEPYAADPDSAVISGVYTIDYTTSTAANTSIILSQRVPVLYDRASVEIYGNVAPATHGETVAEVLGSGDGSRGNQRFALKKPPLTYVPAVTASGSATTLEVRVNGVRWNEVPFLFGHGSREQIYMVRMNNEGVTSVIFGDGINGVRVPTGLENVTARYRSGVGLEGEVAANSLILLQTRPLGIRSVNNPLPATGSAPSERIEDARANAPRTVLTFDRIVSLNDFENFARGFAGVGKVLGTLLWSGNDRIVHLTVAGHDQSAPSTTLIKNLIGAIAALQDPIVQVDVGGFTLVTFNVQVTIEVDPRYVAEDVRAAVRATIISEFSFDKRSFGQRVTTAEMMAVLQRVPGVIGVDVDLLYPTAGPKARLDVIAAKLPHYENMVTPVPVATPVPTVTLATAASDPAMTYVTTTTFVPAELLLVDTTGITIYIR